MSRTIRLMLLALCFSVAGCAQKTVDVQEEPAAAEKSVVPFELPATFTGQIPCDDCLRVDIVLNLRDDDLYQLRKTYQTAQGVGRVDAQMGRWRYSAEGKLVILGKQKGALKTYAFKDPDRLQFVEWQGSGIKAQIAYDLMRSLDLDPFDDVVKIRGMFSMQEDNGWLSECGTDSAFALSRSGAFDKTVQTYLNTPHFSGRPILLSMLGRLEKQDGVEVVVVEQFNRFYPDQDCSGESTGAALTGTYWQLAELDGKEIPLAAGHAAPFLVFDQDKSMAGFGGCNPIAGSYLIQGNVFLVNRTEAARIACPAGMESENRLLQALDEAEVYRLEGNLFDLLDQRNNTKARFRAGP